MGQNAAMVGENDSVIVAAVLLGSFLIGLLAGRWWIVLAPLAFGAWIATATDVNEVPPWFLGLAYALVGVTAALVGVFLRRLAARNRK